MSIREDIEAHERTHPRALEAMRKLGVEGRLRMMSNLIDSMRELMAARIQEQHPDWTRERVLAETARRVASGNS
jgi:hypothetical protein